LDTNDISFFDDKQVVDIEKIETQFEGNELYRIGTDGGVFAVRRMDRGDGDPLSEYVISSMAAKIGIAPQIYCFDPENLLMVSQWIEGESKQRLNADELISLVKTLKTLHSVKFSEQNIQTVDLKTLVKQNEIISEAFDICDRYPGSKALCHNDPNPRNIIWRNKQPYLIDFEYAGLNDVYFDLAAVSVEFGLSEVAQRLMMEEYWEEEACHFDKLYACKAIYEELRRQWLADHQIP